MKLNNSFVLFDSLPRSQETQWAKAHSAISKALKSMRWPDIQGTKKFRIPRIVSIPVGGAYTDADGAKKIVAGKKKTLRNGVKPLKDQFRRWMSEKGWSPEKALSLSGYFEKLGLDKTGVAIKKYPPSKIDSVETISLHQSVGDFDFWFETKSGFRTVVEWETGNISSSHRSLNKMCLALMGQLAEAGVLIVPSIMLYPHLTDRIGNIRELQPYFYFWNRVGTLVPSGLLAVLEIEHDGIFKSTDLRDFVPLGKDGNSQRSTEEG